MSQVEPSRDEPLFTSATLPVPPAPLAHDEGRAAPAERQRWWFGVTGWLAGVAEDEFVLA